MNSPATLELHNRSHGRRILVTLAVDSTEPRAVRIGADTWERIVERLCPVVSTQCTQCTLTGANDLRATEMCLDEAPATITDAYPGIGVLVSA